MKTLERRGEEPTRDVAFRFLNYPWTIRIEPTKDWCVDVRVVAAIVKPEKRNEVRSQLLRHGIDLK